MSMAERPSVAVIGIGSPMRSDDGVGPFVIEQLGNEPSDPEIELLSLDGEPTTLIEAWRDRRFVIVIDAVAARASPGTIHRVEVGVDPLPGWASGPSSHHGGLAEAVALGDVLGRRAERLVVLGVEPASLAAGVALTPGVLASVPTLLNLIHDEIRSFKVSYHRPPGSKSRRSADPR